MRDVFEVSLPDRSPLVIHRETAQPGGRPKHYIMPRGGGPHVIVAVASGSLIRRVLDAYNATFDRPAPQLLCWAVCRPRKGGGWKALRSTIRHTRKEAISAYQVDGSSYKRDRKTAGVQVVKFFALQPTDRP